MTRIALYISYVVLAVCVAALVADLGAYLLHLHYPARVKSVLDVVAFCWVFALAGVAIAQGYMRRENALAAADKQNPTA